MRDDVINYNQLLNEISGEENHLLMGNGFNLSMGMKFSYWSIFERMKEESFNLYSGIDVLVETQNADLEYVLGKLVENIDDNFVKEYIKIKFRIDFMKAVQAIVVDNLPKVYDKNNYGIFLLFEKFDNFFTLNYDSFTYLLLLKYKKSNDGTTLIISASDEQIHLNFDNDLDDIYSECKKIYDSGNYNILVDSEVVNSSSLKLMTLAEKTSILYRYGKSKKLNWKKKDVVKVVKRILDEEKDKNTLTINQVELGFEEGVFSEDTIRNVHQLHGAFHIYSEGNSTKLLESTGINALYSVIEEALEYGDKNIISVFERDNKILKIQENDYLRHCFNKLKSLTGNVVMIGVSCTENDDHIMNEIAKSNVNKIYISFYSEDDLSNIIRLKENIFKDKIIVPVDASTITYSFDENN